MSTARTKLDIIYKDVLGDIQELVSRIESSSKDLNLLHENNKKAVDNAIKSIELASKKAAMTIRSEVRESSISLIKQLDQAKVVNYLLCISLIMVSMPLVTDCCTCACMLNTF